MANVVYDHSNSLATVSCLAFRVFWIWYRMALVRPIRELKHMFPPTENKRDGLLYATSRIRFGDFSPEEPFIIATTAFTSIAITASTETTILVTISIFKIYRALTRKYKRGDVICLYGFKLYELRDSQWAIQFPFIRLIAEKLIQQQSLSWKSLGLAGPFKAFCRHEK